MDSRQEEYDRRVNEVADHLLSMGRTSEQAIREAKEIVENEHWARREGRKPPDLPGISEEQKHWGYRYGEEVKKNRR